ncbi:hypothetical protein Leryth_027099, partial [Lithospermum erythrorhizon]
EIVLGSTSIDDPAIYQYLVFFVTFLLFISVFGRMYLDTISPKVSSRIPDCLISKKAVNTPRNDAVNILATINVIL